MSIEWAHPLWLLALLLLPALFLWRWRAGAALPLPRAGRLRREGIAGPGWAAPAPLVLRALTLTLLILALARPRTPGAVIEEHTEGVPIVVALDLSSSMLAEDFRPRNRLLVAQQTVARFVGQHPDDPIGLVAFAGEAITIVPVTTDHAVLLNALGTLRVGLLEDGTAIGDGLAIAANRLRRAPGRSKVVILMSDGENNRGEIAPLDAAKAAAAFGIEVYTIGVGSQGVARVPVERTPAGLRYQELRVGLDETLLRQMAQVAGGQYFRATNPEALRAIYDRIGALVKARVETTRRTLYTEWALPLLLAAGLLLVVEWLLRGSRWGVVPG
jgi:Ca-activated chloride channel family protein